MDGFAFPFRFASQKISRLDVASDAYKAQLIAAAVYTQINELPFTPDFGSRITPFSGLDMGDLLATIAVYIQSVAITNITQTVNNDQTVSIGINFTSKEDA